MHSISTFAPRGSAATGTVDRAGRWDPKRSPYTSFMAAKSPRSVRKTVVFVTRSRPEPDSTRTAARLSSTRRVCARTSSPPASCPVAGSSAICPAQKTKSPATIAWLYGPTGAGARSVRVLRRSICSPFFERGLDRARQQLIILRQDAPQVERDPFVDDPRDHRRIGAAKRRRQTRNVRPRQRDRERGLGLVGERAAADGRARLDHLRPHPRGGKAIRDRTRAIGKRGRRGGDHPPDRELGLRGPVPVDLERGDERGQGELVWAERTHERMRANRRDQRRAADAEPGLGPAEQLVAAEGDDVGAFPNRAGDRLLRRKTVLRGVEERAAAEIVDVRDVVLAREGGKIAALRPRDEAGQLEVARVHAKDRAGPLSDRRGVVARVRAVRGADLDELRSGPPQDVGNAEATTDLDELATRDDDLLAGRKCREREQDGGGVVVHDAGVLRAGEVGEQSRRVTVPLAALPGGKVELHAHRARGLGDRGEGARRERRPTEVRPEDHAGRVEDTAERASSALVEERAGLAGEGGGVAGGARRARPREDVPRGACEPPAIGGGRPRGAQHRVDRGKLAAGIDALHRASTSSARGRTRIERCGTVVTSPSSCAASGRSSSISTARARFR